jgi:signal transduction histidine kinase
LLSRNQFSGQEVMRVHKVNLSEVVGRALKITKATAQVDGVEISWNVGAGRSYLVSSDEKVLIGVVLNLIDNSLKYRRLASNSRQRVVLGVVKLRGLVRLDVADNGIGISSLDLGQIFLSSWRAEHLEGKRGMGFGLGLASVRRSIDSIPGHHIKVRSKLGLGTRFSLYCPLLQSE